MFAIYSMAILSLEDTRCVYLFGQERAKLLAKYQSATQQALVNAGFLKSSNIMVLQALLLYLVSPILKHSTVIKAKTDNYKE